MDEAPLMDETRRKKLVKFVKDIFDARTRSSEGDKLDADSVPVRIKSLTEFAFTPETQFLVPGRGPQSFSGSIADYHKYHATRVRKTLDKLDTELLDVLAGDKYVAALYRNRDEPEEGKPFEWLAMLVYTFNEAGDKVAVARQFQHDQYGVDDNFRRAYGIK